VNGSWSASRNQEKKGEVKKKELKNGKETLHTTQDETRKA
jgi:hypothetical protein